jgi:hypothetical protein
MSHYTEQLAEWMDDNIEELAIDYESHVERECRTEDTIIEKWEKEREFDSDDFKEYCEEVFKDAHSSWEAKQHARYN